MCKRFRVADDGRLIGADDPLWSLIYEVFHPLFRASYFRALRIGRERYEYFIHNGYDGLTVTRTDYYEHTKI